MTTVTKASEAVVPPWYAQYPAPKSEASSISREDVIALLRDGNTVAGKDFVLVDLRRNDHEDSPLKRLSQGGTIRGSINLPAQSLWPTIPTLYEMFKAVGLRRVIWYCGSSRGRGNRAASWFADYITDKGDSNMESLILVEGIRGWANAGDEYLQWMDEYDNAIWSKNDR